MDFNRKCCCILWIALALSMLITLVTGTTPLPDEISSTETIINKTIPTEIPKLTLAIHYEALCPDSMNFIRRRLYDALTDNNWWPHTELKLYPFGKANFYNNTALGQMEVYCQHGEEECELNALHACILEHFDLDKAFNLIYCMLRSYSNNIDRCAKHLNLDVAAAKECKNSRKTPDILMPYGKETLALEISFVPSIVFDNQFDPYEQRSIRYNFETHFCRHYYRKFQINLPSCG